MKKTLMLLICAAFLVGGIGGCATTNPCAPLINTPVVLEQVKVNMGAYIVKVHDTNGDGIGDTMAVYLQKPGSKEVVEYFNKSLTDKEVATVNRILKEKEAKEKVNSQ
jgi:hypothetical protein